ncbi:CSC1-like protein 1 [Antennarius striatus]|uniref:CSC1-like protein 1 n=1 Tax=Antennarius striatus TaxID=241820 RepID=UPI0035B33740
MSSWWRFWELPFSSSPSVDFANTTCFNSTLFYKYEGDRFGGVPIVLFLDFCVFVMLLFLFFIIRKKFWHYGRLALVADSEGCFESSHQRYGLMYSASDDPEHELGYCNLLPYVLKMEDEKIKEKCGVDAVHYLSFQRHLIVLLLILTATSLGVILPVNLSGYLLNNEFGKTTIGNLQEGNNLLWLHTIFAVLYLILTVFMLRHHTSRIKEKGRETAKRTLFVYSIPKTATEEDVNNYFTEAYPSCTVCAVTLAYNVRKVIYLDKERVRAGKNLCYYEHLTMASGEREQIDPRFCGYLCCCNNSQRVDAIEFYRAKEIDLLEEVRKHVELVPQSPLGIAFVTLQSELMAKLILKDFNALECSVKNRCFRTPPKPSSKSDTLEVNKWQISFAPHPKDLYWENLSARGFTWYIRYLMLNFLLLFLLMFLTTPFIIISVLDKLNLIQPIYYINSAVVNQFFSTLMLSTFSSLLPTIVYYSTLGESHWTRSSEQMSVMRKLYFFLLFMVLILPSLGLTSLAVFIRWLFETEFIVTAKLRFECVFLPNQGAFFVNYVTAAALVGSGMELLRLPGLLLYTIRMALARSVAERKNVKQNQAYEFQYGAMYGWFLCVFTVIMAYSITCPVIVPFGLLYMVLKHLADKHNIYFAYLPSRVDRSVHLVAINQAMAAPIICLIWLYFFSVLRTGFWAPTSVFTLVVLFITVFISIGLTCFGHFRYLSPHVYKVKEEDKVETNNVEESNMVYLPKVLNFELPASVPEESKPQQSNGSIKDSPANSFAESWSL